MRLLRCSKLLRCRVRLSQLVVREMCVAGDSVETVMLDNETRFKVNHAVISTLGNLNLHLVNPRSGYNRAHCCCLIPTRNQHNTQYSRFSRDGNAEIGCLVVERAPPPKSGSTASLQRYLPWSRPSWLSSCRCPSSIFIGLPSCVDFQRISQSRRKLSCGDIYDAVS